MVPFLLYPKKQFSDKGMDDADEFHQDEYEIRDL